jgi:hypothetical protein
LDQQARSRSIASRLRKKPTVQHDIIGTVDVGYRTTKRRMEARHASMVRFRFAWAGMMRQQWHASLSEAESCGKNV